MIKVTNEIRVYQVDGRDTVGDDPPVLAVCSSRSRAYVDLCIEGRRFTVKQRDLDDATANATRTGAP